MFTLTDEDYEAIRIAKNCAQLLLDHPKITATQTTHITKALSALNKLPDVTPDIFYKYQIFYTNGDDERYERRYMSFTITEDMFEITDGGSVYDSSVGHDTLPSKSWMFHTTEDSVTELELPSLPDEFSELLNLGAEIITTDQG